MPRIQYLELNHQNVLFTRSEWIISWQNSITTTLGCNNIQISLHRECDSHNLIQTWIRNGSDQITIATEDVISNGLQYFNLTSIINPGEINICQQAQIIFQFDPQSKFNY